MKKILFPVLVGISLLFCSCKTTSTFETHLESFVTAYYDYANYKLKINSVGDIIVLPEYGNIYYENSQNQDDLNRFAELSSKYGDANFNKRLVTGEPVVYPNIMAAENIVSIELICLEDINEQYKSNNSVANLFMLSAVSPLKYIQSKYTQKGDNDDWNFVVCSYFVDCYQSFKKPLDEVAAEDLVLIGNGEFPSTIVLALAPKDMNNCPAWGKKLRLTLNYENQYPISKDFVFERGTH